MPRLVLLDEILRLIDRISGNYLIWRYGFRFFLGPRIADTCIAIHELKNLTLRLENDPRSVCPTADGILPCQGRAADFRSDDQQRWNFT